MRNIASISIIFAAHLNRIFKTIGSRFCTVLLLFLFIHLSIYAAPKKNSRELLLIQECLGFEKKTLVSQNMNLNILDQRRFWPIYEDYEKDRADLVEKKLSLLEKYIENNSETTDIELDLIHTQSVSVEKKLQEAQDKVYESVKKELGVQVAMRFLQIDDHITATITLYLLNRIPIKGALTKEEREKLEEERSKNIE